MLDLEKSSIELSSFDMNEAFNKIPINENIVYLKTMFEESNNVGCLKALINRQKVVLDD